MFLTEASLIVKRRVRMCQQRVPVDNRAVSHRSLQSLRCHRTDRCYGPVLLLLVHQVRHQTPEPEAARGFRQTRDQGEGGADRGGSGGQLLCSGNVNVAGAPVLRFFCLLASGSPTFCLVRKVVTRSN